jgi:hypothetical protein
MIDHLANPEPFGPWRADLDPTERRCRWRALCALALVYAGPDSQLAAAARAAEQDEMVAGQAWQALLSLPPLQRRRLLSAWGVMNALGSQ